ncbi:MAG: hypothetical protein HYT94_05270 [Parcubacteria group bacterium]|nr:hypothetical protein [Parcubacteria group bacterium]
MEQHSSPFHLTPEQQQDGHQYWEKFFAQKVMQVANALKEHGWLADPSVQKALNDALAEVRKTRQTLVSKEELSVRAIEFFVRENNGVISQKLEKEYVEALLPLLVQRLRQLDYDTVNEPLQAEIDTLIKDKGIVLSTEGVGILRDKFWERFNAIKTKEYEQGESA